MIETTIMEYLANALDAPVYMEEPERPPRSYILIEKAGGGSSGPLKRASVIIQSYAETLEKAAVLNDRMIQAMEDIADQDPISRCELDSDYNYTDLDTKRYRYQAVFDLIYYG